MNTMEKSLLAYLSKYPNGVSESILIADMNTYPGRNVKRALSTTFGVYVDRWEWSPLKNDFVPVYRAVEVPPDAKKPEKPVLELKNGTRISGGDPHAAYLADRRIHRSLVAQQ